MRMGWRTITKDIGPKIEVYDLKINILDKDNNIHTKTLQGGWRFGEDIVGNTTNPHAIDLVYKADYIILQHKEYIITDKGLRIPRCNIKNVSYEKINQEMVQPSRTFRGIPDWNSYDWFAFTFMSGVLGFFSLLVFSAIYKMTKG